MGKSTLVIQLDTNAKKILEKRAKKEYLSLNELVSNILRRSILSYKKRSSMYDNIDDKFLTYFSRKTQLKNKKNINKKTRKK